MPNKCNCNVFSRPEGSDHLPWCAWLTPEAPVTPQRPSTAEILREITGGGVPCPACGARGGCLHGIPAAVGTSEEFPLTSRPGAYLAQPRDVPVASKRYLGDGVYVDIDDRGLILTTENGIAVTNTIVLESEVWAALHRYVEAQAMGRDA